MLDDTDYGMIEQMDPDSGSRYNGTVQTDEGDIEVRNGVAVVGKEMYFVDNSGRLVADGEGNLVGVIQDGKVSEVTPEILDQLKAEGMVE